MDSFSFIHQQFFCTPCRRVVFYLSHPSTVVVYIIWCVHSCIGLIHQQLFRISSGMNSSLSSINFVLCAPSGMGSSSLFSSIDSCFVHHLVWIPSSFSSINSYVVHHLVCIALHWSRPSTIVSYIIWYGFFSLVLQQLLCAPSGMSRSSLFSSINSYFVHHLVWIPSSV